MTKVGTANLSITGCSGGHLAQPDPIGIYGAGERRTTAPVFAMWTATGSGASL